MDAVLFRKLTCVNCRNPALQQKKDELVCSVCGQNVPLHNNIPNFLSRFCIGKLSWRDGNWNPYSYESYISQIPHRLKKIDEPLLHYVRGEVLEIGCGTCRLAPQVEKRGAKYFGLDPVFSFLLYAHKRRGLQKLVCGQGERLPFQDESFDCLISGFYTYRYVNSELGLPEARRVLKKGGKFVFDLLNHWILKLMQLKSLIKKGDYNILRSFCFRPSSDTFEFVNLLQLKQKAEKSGFLVENVISTSVQIFPVLNKYISNFYFRGKKTIYLGYDVVVALKAV